MCLIRKKIILGGAVANLEGFLERILEEFDKLYKRIYHNLYRPINELCTFSNDANLVGAIYKFMKTNIV